MRRAVFIPADRPEELPLAQATFPGDTLTIIRVTGPLTNQVKLRALSDNPAAQGADVLTFIRLPFDTLLTQLEGFRQIDPLLARGGTALEIVRSHCLVTHAHLQRVIRHFAPHVGSITVVNVDNRAAVPDLTRSRPASIQRNGIQ